MDALQPVPFWDCHVVKTTESAALEQLAASVNSNAKLPRLTLDRVLDKDPGDGPPGFSSTRLNATEAAARQVWAVSGISKTKDRLLTKENVTNLLWWSGRRSRGLRPHVLGRGACWKPGQRRKRRRCNQIRGVFPLCGPGCLSMSHLKINSLKASMGKKNADVLWTLKAALSCFYIEQLLLLYATRTRKRVFGWEENVPSAPNAAGQCTTSQSSGGEVKYVGSVNK